VALSYTIIVVETKAIFNLNGLKMYKEVDSQMNLPKVEEDILRFWDADKTFEKSLEIRKDAPLYSFYDGPPFATGTPHYGHLLASTMKDVVPRYWTMRGYRVDRVWGWDCHGLPIENIAEKELGYTHKKDILELGVGKFNAICRSKVLGYVAEWKNVIHRLGRWVDMENAYSTMDFSYMESVWWVFKQLWDKDLIYEGYRSMHICPRCETTLSQSEVAEGYRVVKDLSAIARFPIPDQADTYLLAWTTTPWTLIANVALAVGSKIAYVKIQAQDEDRGTAVKYILAKERLGDVFKDKDYEILEEFLGEEIVGTKYEPIFDYYYKQEIKNKENGWQVYSANFVTTEDGTGIVHIAPGFGEDDLNLAKQHQLPLIQHVGMDGIIKKEAGHFAGMNVKDITDNQKTDVEIIKDLAHRGLLFFKEKFEHSYPHCWRCDTPLLNYATSSWFVAVTKIKPEALELAKEINWSPKHIKEGRFGKWLEGAKDWSISRQRFWASVMPIWKCDQCGELEVFGSAEELESKSGQKITDLHKDTVDNVTYNCAKCSGEMRRIPDVLDTWFDSGSMPFAQIHYPFENKAKFEKIAPADYIAEYQDQCRAWFYYLHVLSSAITGKIAFKNSVVSGTILAEDGKKMSKRLQNYPDPKVIFDKYGADVLRFYLTNSPVMQAENLNFSEKEVAELSRGMFRMLWNSYSFFTLYANIDKWESNKNTEYRIQNTENVLDRWIISELNQLIADINKGMESYDLTKSARLFAPFIDNLSNWYIRRSRKRFWKSENDGDKDSAYQTLWEVLVTLSRLIAPFTPFIADEIYKNLTGEESVHLGKYPESNKALIDGELNLEMQDARRIVEMGLSARAAGKVKVRQPLEKLEYHGNQLSRELEIIIADEVNVKKVLYSKGDSNSVELDLIITEGLKLEGLAREIIRNIQSLRKKSNFKVDDRIKVYYQTDSADLKTVMENTQTKEMIAKEVLANEMIQSKVEAEGEEDFRVEGQHIWIGLIR